MDSAVKRAAWGFIAAVIAALTFHQGMWELLHVAKIPGLGMPPLGVPRVLSLCFWGGLYGIVFGLLMPKFRLPIWLCGLLTGFIAAFVDMVIVNAIKGLPIGGGWVLMNWARSLLIFGSWGLGLGLILPLMLPRSVQN
jgi:tetrahydromethanopterin S-methyltransferase subunit C